MYVKPKKTHYVILTLTVIISIIFSVLSLLKGNNNDCLPFALILTFVELYAIKKLHVSVYKKIYNHTHFSLVVALLCGMPTYLFYLLITTLFKIYVKKDLQLQESWKLNYLIQFFSMILAGSVVYIISSNYIDFNNLLNLDNLSMYILLVILYNFIVSLPFTIIQHVDNRASYKDSQDSFVKINIESFFIYSLYHLLLITAYFSLGLIGAILVIIISYLAEHYIEQIYLIKIESVTDALTGVYNRGYLDRLVQKYKVENRRFSIIMLDIDNFKNINETYNHLVGDIVLTEFAKVIRLSLRENDIIARYGGEEFVVILENVSIENTIMISERIRRNIEKKIYHCPYKEYVYEIKHTSSLGIGVYNNKHPNNVIEEADNNLKVAKHTGKNKIYYHDEKLLPQHNKKE